MAVANIFQSRVLDLDFDLDRRQTSGPGVDRLLSDIALGIKDLKRRNQDLEEENSELQAALEKANERITQLINTSVQAADMAIVRPLETRANGSVIRNLREEMTLPVREPNGRLIEPEPATSTIELVASRFNSFSALNSFYQQVRALPGVIDVEAKGFEKGTVHVAITYRHNLPLAELLAQMSGFSPRVVSMDEGKLEIAL